MGTLQAVLWFLLAVAVIGFALFVMWGPANTLSLFVPNYRTSPLPAAALEGGTERYSPTQYMEKGYLVTEVVYTNTGFVPQVITIDKGTVVRFINRDNLSMRITSQGFDAVPSYPGFDQPNSVGMYGKYDFTFNSSGLWSYHNMNADPGVVGVVYVR